jgi:hypothetical protein
MNERKGTFGDLISVRNDKYQCSGCTDLCSTTTGEGTKPPVSCHKNLAPANWRKVED